MIQQHSPLAVFATESTGSAAHLAHGSSVKHEVLSNRLDVSADKPVCSACRRDVTRMLGDSRYIPRWERSSKPMQCTIEQCSDRVFTSLHKIGSTNLSAALETARLTSSKKTARCLYASTTTIQCTKS